MTLLDIRENFRDRVSNSWDAAKQYSKKAIDSSSARIITIAIPVVIGIGAIYIAIQPTCNEETDFTGVELTTAISVVDRSTTAVGVFQDVALLAAGTMQGLFGLLGIWGATAHVEREYKRVDFGFEKRSKREGSIEKLSRYCSRFSPVCSANIATPFVFPPAASSARTMPFFGLLDKIEQIIGSLTINPKLGIIEAIAQNHLPILLYWLEKDDRVLAWHLAPNSNSLSNADIYSPFLKFIKYAAKKGNYAIVLALLDRYQNVKDREFPEEEMGILVMAAFESALEGEQQDVILAVLRKGYLICCDVQEKMVQKLVSQYPQIALELSGEDICFEALEGGIKAAVENNHAELLCAFLDRHDGEKLWPAAGVAAAKKGDIALLKELLRRGLLEKDVPDLPSIAFEAEQTETVQFLVSQGFSCLNDKKVSWSLFKTGGFPSEFSSSMLEGLNSRQIASLLETYIRGNGISDQALMAAWPENPIERSLLCRVCLADRSPLSSQLQQFLTNEFVQFSSETQELMIRIAILKDHSSSWIDALMMSRSQESKERLSTVRVKRSEFRERLDKLRSRIGQYPIPSLWNEEEIRSSILERGPEILDWNKSKKDHPQYIYFESSDRVGQLKSMPHLVLKSLSSLANATHVIALAQKVRSACEEKQLKHLRIPNTLFVTSLKNRVGAEVPIHLIVKEFLPVASHKIAEIKEFLEALNRDPESRKMVNDYLSELTSLICKTGLYDMKASNAPFLADGSGFGIVDYDGQGVDAPFSLYKFRSFGVEEGSLMDGSLIGWLAPQNFEALQKALNEDPDCPKEDFDRIEFEKRRERKYEQEREIQRFYLIEYGVDDQTVQKNLKKPVYTQENSKVGFWQRKS